MLHRPGRAGLQLLDAADVGRDDRDGLQRAQVPQLAVAQGVRDLRLQNRVGAGRVRHPHRAAAAFSAGQGQLLLAFAFLAGNIALQYGASRLPAHTTALVMLSEVVFASLSSVAFGAAQLTPPVLAGGALILAAAAWSAWPLRRTIAA